MQICIAGWYFDNDLLKLMKKINEDHPVHIVAHREGDAQGLPMTVIDNIGLEFHMYNHFIMELWDEKSNVLFMHDDIEIAPVMVNYEIIPAINIFNKIGKLGIDQGYVFQNEDDAKWNAFKHGRMIYMSGRLAKRVKDTGGIWYDKDNTGQTTTGPYNAGIVNFHEKMLNITPDWSKLGAWEKGKEYNTCNVIFAPAFRLLRRNNEPEFYGNQAVGGS